MDLKKAIAMVLKDLRKERNLSQEKLAEKCGVSTTVIGRFESWEREPKLSSIFKLATAFDIKAAELIQRIDDKRKEK